MLHRPETERKAAVNPPLSGKAGPGTLDTKGIVMDVQLEVDFHRVAGGGLTRGRASDAAPGVVLRRWDYIVVADEDAEPAVAQVVDLTDDGAVLLRILPGSAAENAHLLSDAVRPAS